MKVVQWNTHHGGKRTDNKLDIDGFGRALKALEADVICLNEVEQFNGYGNIDQVKTWTDILGPEWRSYFANLTGIMGGQGQGNAILTRFPVNGLSGARGLYDSRSAVAVRLDKVTIVATHLDNEKPTSRVCQLFQALGWEPASGSTVIVCGDWNTQPGALEMAPLRTFYKDAWTHAGARSSFNGSGATRGTRIDAIYFRGLTCLTVDVPDTRIAGVFPSDHSPVVAVFS